MHSEWRDGYQGKETQNMAAEHTFKLNVLHSGV